jgi:hypothetical protein
MTTFKNRCNYSENSQTQKEEDKQRKTEKPKKTEEQQRKPNKKHNNKEQNRESPRNSSERTDGSKERLKTLQVGRTNGWALRPQKKETVATKYMASGSLLRFLRAWTRPQLFYFWFLSGFCSIYYVDFPGY